MLSVNTLSGVLGLPFIVRLADVRLTLHYGEGRNIINVPDKLDPTRRAYLSFKALVLVNED